MNVKKFVALLMMLVMALSFACAEEKLTTYQEYVAADMQDEVLIEMYVQATQSWWSDKITVYAADHYGAYFVYEMACSEEDAAKLVPGTKILVHGYKTEWAGEVEIMDGTFTFVEDGETYIAEPVYVTEYLGTDELISFQNQKVVFNGMTVVSVTYKNDEPGDDIYVKLEKEGAEYDFCVERYLTGPETDVYAAVGALEVGDVIDVEGFLYWYENVNTHITAVKPAMTVHDAYVASAVDAEMEIPMYVQATQSWWDNKITVYAADKDGGYFIYEMACSEEDAQKLVPGTKILVHGFRGEWAGEIELMDATFTFVEDGDTYIAEAIDVTELLGTEELIKHQNEKVLFKGLEIVSITYKNDEPGDDIYVKVAYNGAEYDFCVERYLTGPDTDVYAAVGALNAGDVIDVEGFLYWYEGVNTHITAVTAAE